MSSTLILAVDDDPLNQEIILASLADTGFEVVSAENGQRALELLEQQGSRFDAVILDRMMPGLDGMEVLRRLKLNPSWAELPVVMQTAAATPAQVEEGLRAGAYYYLTKPYSPAALRTIVRAALEAQSWRRKVSERTRELEGLRFMRTARFVVRTLREASELATLLAGLCPDPQASHLGLAELLLNAVEHGNLGITYADKTRLLEEGRWLEEVERRQELAAYRGREVEVRLEQTTSLLAFTIVDQGQGFDWRSYLDFDPARAFDPNGRGIALARARSFTRLEYEGAGNRVVATIALGGAG